MERERERERAERIGARTKGREEGWGVNASRRKGIAECCDKGSVCKGEKATSRKSPGTHNSFWLLGLPTRGRPRCEGFQCQPSFSVQSAERLPPRPVAVFAEWVRRFPSTR